MATYQSCTSRIGYQWGKARASGPILGRSASGAMPDLPACAFVVPLLARSRHPENRVRHAVGGRRWKVRKTYREPFASDTELDIRVRSGGQRSETPPSTSLRGADFASSGCQIKRSRFRPRKHGLTRGVCEWRRRSSGGGPAAFGGGRPRSPGVLQLQREQLLQNEILLAAGPLADVPATRAPPGPAGPGRGHLADLEALAGLGQRPARDVGHQHGARPRQGLEACSATQWEPGAGDRIARGVRH